MEDFFGVEESFALPSTSFENFFPGIPVVPHYTLPKLCDRGHMNGYIFIYMINMNAS